MDLNILPLEERIVMDAAGGILESSDAAYVDASKSFAQKEVSEVDSTAISAQNAAESAAESVLAGISASSEMVEESCSEEEKELLRMASSDVETQVNEDENITFTSNFEGTSDWVRADNLLDNNERIEFLMRGF